MAFENLLCDPMLYVDINMDRNSSIPIPGIHMHVFDQIVLYKDQSA